MSQPLHEMFSELSNRHAAFAMLFGEKGNWDAAVRSAMSADFYADQAVSCRKIHAAMLSGIEKRRHRLFEEIGQLDWDCR